MFKIEKFKTEKDKVIYHFIFDSQREMNESFMRFSEFIESPLYKNQEIIKSKILKYIPNYNTLVLRHNIPGDQFEKFLNIHLPFLLTKEKKIYNEVKHFPDFSNMYLIATFKSKKYNSIDHELAHALFYLDEKYKYKVNSLLLEKEGQKFEFFGDMTQILDYKKYSWIVWWDEIHAFLIDLGLGSYRFFYGNNLKDFIVRLFKKKVFLHFKYLKIAKKLTQIYQQHKEELIFIEEEN